MVQFLRFPNQSEYPGNHTEKHVGLGFMCDKGAEAFADDHVKLGAYQVKCSNARLDVRLVVARVKGEIDLFRHTRKARDSDMNTITNMVVQIISDSHCHIHRHTAYNTSMQGRKLGVKYLSQKDDEQTCKQMDSTKTKCPKPANRAVFTNPNYMNSISLAY